MVNIWWRLMDCVDTRHHAYKHHSPGVVFVLVVSGGGGGNVACLGSV